MSQLDKQLPKGTLYVSIGQAAFLLSGYVMHALLARWLAPAAYGIFGVAMTVLVWIEITVNNGVPSALQRFLPDRTLAETSVRRAAARCQAAVAVGVFGAMFALAPFLARLLRDPSLTGYLRLAFVDVLAMAAYGYYRGMLNGWRAFRQLSMTITAYSVTKVAAISLLVYQGYGIQGALVGNIIASLGGLAAGYVWTRRHDHQAATMMVEPAAPNGTLTQVSERQILAFVIPAALFTLASNLLLSLDLMAVKALVKDADQVGFYSAAVNLANAPRLVLLAFSFTLLPSLSGAISANDVDQIRYYLQQIVRLLMLVLLPILALVTATAIPAVEFVFSAPYRPAAPILAVLIFTYAVYTIYITMVTVLLAENRPGRALAIPITVLPIAVLVVWLGVRWMGGQGAAYAALLNVTLAALVVIVYVWRRFRPPLASLGVSLARTSLASAILWALARWWSPSGLLLLLAYVGLGVLYVALLLVLREVTAQDLAMVASWFPLSKKAGGS